MGLVGKVLCVSVTEDNLWKSERSTDGIRDSTPASWNRHLSTSVVEASWPCQKKSMDWGCPSSEKEYRI